MKVDELPSVIEMASYTLFVPQCALGVFFEYRDFKCWAESREEYENVPSPIIPSLKWFFFALLTVAIFSVGSAYFPVKNNWDESFIESSSVAWRIFYPALSWGFQRYFYYTAFLFQTGTMVACGFGFNGRYGIYS